MHLPSRAHLRRFIRHCLGASGAVVFGTIAAKADPAVGKATADAPVTIVDAGRIWKLANGLVEATISKANGNLTSLRYNGRETMGAGGYWEQTPEGAPTLTQRVTIDPATNDGARVEVSVKGVTGGSFMLSPKAPGGGSLCDIEVRYALGRGESGIYAYAIFSHPTDYGAMGLGESRYITKLSHTFDWISVDADRNMLECTPADWGGGVVIHAKEQRVLRTGYYKNSVEHKYSYAAIQFKIPAFGWSSVKDHIGVWFINPTTEYLSGGATKQELVCHLDGNNNPDPIILDYWRGTHYGGGAQCAMEAGEEWSKVIGPIFIYCNTLENADDPLDADLETLEATAGNPTIPPAWRNNALALWRDALEQAEREKARWPYEWVSGVDYPHKEGRGEVVGQLSLDDPQAADPALHHLTVGLAHADYPRQGRNGAVDWAHDAKYYQFWVTGSEDGKFVIPNVRPGQYTLHAFADGVLGELAQAEVAVAAGQRVDLGMLEWKPARYGRQVWEIGYPDRTAGKFYKGDGENYWLWGWCVRAGELFPKEITYTVGESDYHTDWFFEQTPRAVSAAWKNPEAKDPLQQRFGWVRAIEPEENLWREIGRGEQTTRTIKFNLEAAAQGRATLRVALAGADGGGGLGVAVNGTALGTLPVTPTNALRYNTDKGVWQEHGAAFDAALLRAGENKIELTVPAGELTTGVVYDYLRLELDEAARPTGAPRLW